MDMEGLSVICAGLGTVEEDRNGNRIGYTKGEYCLDNLKDLMRFLRRDDPQNRDVFKQVCKWNTVSKDLIPIIENFQDDRNLVLNSVKILVFLTMPIEPSSNDIAQQIEYMWGLKSSVMCGDIIAVIVSLLENPLVNLERDAFTEDDWKLVQLILTLFRNLLAIQEISLQQKAVGTATHFLSLRDRFLELLFRENVMDLIIVITQHFGGYLRQDNLLLLEIFHYIFLGQEPELVSKAHLKGSKTDEDANKASLNSLKSIMEEEEEKRRLTRVRNLVRHSHFIGTFTRLSMDGSKSVFNGKPASVSSDAIIKPHKVHRGPTKKIAWNHGRLPSSKDKILELLHDFVNQFLTGGYNGLMQSIRQDIEKEHHMIQKSDIIIFFQVAQFATSFQYHKVLTSKPNMGADAPEVHADTHTDDTLHGGNICGPVAESMNDSMFQLVFSHWRNKFESLKETHEFKFMSAAGSLMKTMICMLDLALQVLPEDSKESQTARILLYKLFYDQTDQGLTHFLLNLLKSFDTHKQAKSDLEDLVEMIYKILNLMENLQARGTLRVSKKSRKGRKKKALNDKETKAELSGEHSTFANEIGVSNIEPPAEKGDAHTGVENTSSDDKQETTTPAHTDKCEGSVLETDISGGSLPQMDHKNSGCANEDPYGTGDSSSDEQAPETNEVDFQVSTLVSSFANNNIIQKLCWLLKFYKSNSTSTNNYIIRMLRRISDDLELSPMLYQLSLLTTFYDILAEQKSCPCQEYADIVNFLTSLIRKMLKKMKKQPLLFVEILFWKTRKECHYINAEYLLHELGHWKKESKNREKNLGDVDVGSSQGNGWTHVSIADALGEDEAGVVINHDLENNNEENIGKVKGSTSSILDGGSDGQENNHNGENSMKHKSQRVAEIKKRKVLGGEFDEKIRNLYEKFNNSQNCSGLIAEELDPDGKISSFQVSKKLKQLGLKCASRKRLRKSDEPNSFEANKLDGEERVVETSGTLHNSGDLEQTLLSQPTRARKRIRAFSEEEETTIRSLYEQGKTEKSRVLTEDVAEPIDAGKLTEDVSDNEFLTSVLKKAREPLAKSKEVKLTPIPIKMNDSEDSPMLEPAGPDKGVASDMVIMDDTREGEAITNDIKNPLDAVLAADSLYDLPHEVNGDDNDLEDSDDEIDHSEFSRSVVSRRRMVFDVEDDD
ncbi:topoisomerase 1-associated factor 1 [Humulus lupulus]|uniref:topoisomerase 1-associated factor 1 n=1 Tax=Humulus lupulus TaxID=3486 RepID=UPI002B403FED|nr:topoisomerase 1-associated factor 1 [Humulus lupulus]